MRDKRPGEQEQRKDSHGADQTVGEEDAQVALGNEHRLAERCFRAVTQDYGEQDRKSTCLNSSHLGISYAVFCLKKKKTTKIRICLIKNKKNPNQNNTKRTTT